ncbi:hypothetical protein ISTM_102 [Insectomime virus]|uniref:Uncharacterized protein n=1 Tax=Tunisvirus fontaine2 TaxID=1421067 RepID=V9SGC2_9VIRU|nr:hypothetical protein D1R32_gp222 [Tunisvirus fontaine2]AHA46000.1 hypothetical protein ISTM_102 [Insectomime virus]AHC54939.1 hypothetical protein TNS_ORF221 [Tunisvirus fontaine2]
MFRLEQANQKFEEATKFTESIIHNQDIWDLCKIMDVEAELYREAGRFLQPGDIVLLKGQGDAIFLQLNDETFMGFSRTRGFFEEGTCYIRSVSNNDPQLFEAIKQLGFVRQEQ